MPALPALATAADLAGRLTVAVPAEPLLTGWNDALLDASNALRDAIGQPITPAVSTLSVAVNEFGFALIPVSPVVSVTAVVDPNGVTLPTDGSAFQVRGQRLNIFGPYYVSAPWGTSVDPTYHVTVSHGWSVIPGEILRWVYVLAAAQIQSVGNGNLGMNGGVTSVAIDDGKVTYADMLGMIPERVQARLKAMYGGEQ